MMKGGFQFLLLGVALYYLTATEATEDSYQRCDDEAAVKISQLFGLRHHLIRKQESTLALIKEIRRAEYSLNYTVEGTEELQTAIENMSTAEIRALELSQTCDANIPRDCCQVKQMFPSAKSGLYAIQDPCEKLFTTSRLTVYCDMETDGGGWIVIQRRNASMGWVNFTKKWADYEEGFGDLDGEFWIGLKNINELTNQQNMALKMRVWNDTENSINWNYQLFRIYEKNYRYAVSVLSGSSGSGSGGDGYGPFSRGPSSAFQFHTYDRYSGSNCGFSRQSGWWYYGGNCGEYSNLNGRHQPSGISGTYLTGERLSWRTSSGNRIYTHSEMKIRPQSCSLR